MVGGGLNSKVKGVDCKHNQLHLVNPSDSPFISPHPPRESCGKLFVPTNISFVIPLLMIMKIGSKVANFDKLFLCQF